MEEKEVYLIPHEHADIASIENEITHKVGRSIIHEDSLLLVVIAADDHIEDDIL